MGVDAGTDDGVRIPSEPIEGPDQPDAERVMTKSFLIALLSLWTAGNLAAQRDVPRQWSLVGRIVDASTGAALAGAQVRIAGHQATGYPLHWSWLDWIDPAAITTAADGRFAFSLPVMPGRGRNDGYPARIHLHVAAPGRVGVFGSRDFSFFFDEPLQDTGDIALPNGCKRPFRVVDTDGTPQRGATVHARPAAKLAPSGSWWAYDATIYARTDGDGRVAGGPLPFGQVRVEVKGRRPVGPAVVDVAETQGAEVAEPIECVVAAVTPAPSIRGRVVDANGAPVAGYLLYAIARPAAGGAEESLATHSAADGSFEVSPAGLQLVEQVRLRHPRNKHYDNWHELGEYRWGDQGIEVRLLAPAKVRLRVRADGKPQEQLAVHAVPLQDGALGADPVRLAGTFPDGVVELDGLRATQYALRVHAIGGSAWPTEWLEFDAAATTAVIDVELPMPIERKLHVFTAEGRAVVGGNVELVVGARPDFERLEFDLYDHTMTESQPSRSFAPMRRVARGTTDRAGAVHLRCPPRDEPVYLVVREGGAQTTVHELPNWTAGRGPIVVAVPGAGALRGTIAPAAFVTALDASSPVERQQAAKFGLRTNPWRQSLADLRDRTRPRVALRGAQDAPTSPFALSCSIGEDGSFTIAGVPPGRYTAVLVLPAGAEGPRREQIVVPALGVVEIVAGEVVDVQYATPAVVQDRVAKVR